MSTKSNPSLADQALDAIEASLADLADVAPHLPPKRRLAVAERLGAQLLPLSRLLSALDPEDEAGPFAADLSPEELASVLEEDES